MILAGFSGPVFSFLHVGGKSLELSPYPARFANEHPDLPGVRDLWQLGAIEVFPDAARGCGGAICRFALC